LIREQTRHLCFTPEDLADPYRLVAFQVPEGTASLTVRYEYVNAADKSRAGKEASGSIIDLGLFDPRGHAFLDGAGFRGWSGGARSEVKVGQAEATPGYLLGPLYPGTWHAILGLYRIAPEGCEVTVTLTSTPGETGAATPPAYAPAGVLREGAAWYRGDLHAHTHHSDATADVATLAAAARAQGLDFCAVTDHNTVSHLPHLAAHSGPDLLLIPGVEITTYRGHANVWGVRAWQEFRAQTDDQMRQIRERVREQGLLFSVNHPKYGGPPWEYDSAFDADAVEVWQAPWFLSNYQSLAFWDDLLRAGVRPTLVGGSDKHQGTFDGTLGGYEVGTPTTWVYAEALSEAAILEGIRAGHVFVSRNPAGVRLDLTARAGREPVMMGDVLKVREGARVSFTCRVDGAVGPLRQGCPSGCEAPLLRVVRGEGQAACVPIDGDRWTYSWQVVARVDDYYRAEVIEPPTEPLDEEPSSLVAFALSNPIYIRLL
jgi:hypothetical protein